MYDTDVNHVMIQIIIKEYLTINHYCTPPLEVHYISTIHKVSHVRSYRNIDFEITF